MMNLCIFLYPRSGGLGLWFTELQNRIDNSPDSEDTICGILESKNIENANFSLSEDLTVRKLDLCIHF